MAEYIERGALEIDLNGRLDFLSDLNGVDDHYTMGFFEAVIRAKEFPSADAAPVVHGRWEWDTEDIYRCSNCAEKSHVKEVMGHPDWDYCPHCGTRMDGSSNEE